MATAQSGTLLHHIRKLADTGSGKEHTDRQLLEDFAAGRTEAAFAALVSRHGPMVLRVCRRVLHHEQDAEDAFQATFLVLAQNTAAIRKQDAVGGWLYGVAYRTAMKAKRSAARRRKHEAQARTIVPAAVAPRWDEVQGVLDEEVQRLSPRFRAAFVLCILDGKSGLEAAAELGCKEGTVRTRVNRARRLLQGRLARRGIELTALPAALSVAASASLAAVPATLIRATRRFGPLVAAGEPAAAVIPSHIAALAAGVTRAMFLTKAKIATALLIALGLVAAGATALARQALAAPPEAAKAQADAKPPAKPHPPSTGEKDGVVDVRGRVLDPDGRPVTGAKLVFVYYSGERLPEKVWATTAADGRFHFPVTRSIPDGAWSGNTWDHTYVVAAADGHGFAWVRVRPETSADVTLRLVKDDVPIQGRVLDLQGKPVAGATVRVDNELFVHTKEDLTDWLKAIKAKKTDPGYLGVPDFTVLRSAALLPLFPPVKTGADGRFQIQGIGRERVASLRVEGPTIATQQVKAMTRPAEKARSAPRGASFDLLAVPTRPVVGMVRDKDTGKPLAGVTVRSHRIAGAYDLNGLVQTTTDKEGRYRLLGLPKSADNAIIAETTGYLPRADDRPYFSAIEPVRDPLGLEAVTVDIAVKRGVWVEGHVIDKATGKTVTGRAGIEYFCFSDNPLASTLPIPDGFPSHRTRNDGSFRVLALPGRGVIAVRAGGDEYRMAVGADRIKGPWLGRVLDTHPYQLYPGNFHTVVQVSPGPSDESITCDVLLDAGRTLEGTVLGPDGKPLAGALPAGLRPMRYWEAQPLKEAEFTLRGLGPDERRLLQMIHEGKKLAGWLEVRGDEKGPVRIRLEPGSVTGRLVTPDGEPMTTVAIRLGDLPRVQPGKDGKFRVDGMAPGLKYSISVTKAPYLLEISGKSIEGLTTRPGETKDLGDIRVKPME